MNEKPITENMKEKANALYHFLYHNRRYCTKAEIGEYLGIKDERVVRDVIPRLPRKSLF